MQININIESEIENVEQEINLLQEQEQNLETLDKIQKLKERHGELVAELTRRDSKHGITYFKGDEIGITPDNLTRSNIKSIIRKANKGVDKPIYTTLGDLF